MAAEVEDRRPGRIQITCADWPSYCLAGAAVTDISIGTDMPAKKGWLVLNRKSRVSAERGATSEALLLSSLSDEDTPSVWGEGKGSIELHLEDFSLDTCFTALVLRDYSRLKAIRSKKDPQLKKWQSYVDRYEQGFLHAADPSQSVAALFTAFAHSRLLGFRKEDPAKLSKAFAECLDFLEGLLKHIPDPEAPWDPLSVQFVSIPGLTLAAALVEDERQYYAATRQRSHIIQLYLPIGDPLHPLHIRPTVRVDALIVEELQPFGALKEFARKDKSSPSGQGFKLIFSRRPGEAGTGNDMTISVSPETECNLVDLWAELERTEEALWNGTRPKNSPRPLKSFGFNFKGVVESDNPWYDGGESCTIIGAPHSSAEGKPATKLDWDRDVIPIALRTYFLDEVDKQFDWTGIAPPAPSAESITAPDSPSPAKTFVRVTPKLGTSTRLTAARLEGSTTFSRWLGLLASGIDPKSLPRELLAHLPTSTLEISGATVVAVPQGVAMLSTSYDSSSEVTAAIQRMRTIFDDINTALVESFSLLKDCLEGGKPQPHRELVQRTSEVREILLRVENGLEHGARCPTAKAIQAHLSEAWSIEGQLDKTRSRLERLDQLSQERQERGNRHFNVLLSAIAAGFVGRELFMGIAEKFQINSLQWQLALFRSNTPLDVLEQYAARASHIEWAGIAGLIFGAFFGVWLALRGVQRLT